MLFPLIAAFIFGAIFASFAGVIAGRMHTGQSWISGRSRCDACGRTLTLIDLLPVLSWLIARGRCRSCGSRIPFASLAGEVVLGALFALAYHMVGLTLALAPLLAALVILFALVLYDVAHTVVPPTLSALLALCALMYALLSAPGAQAFGFALAAAGGIALALALLHALSGGRAMGLGDAPVAFSLSLLAAPLALSGLVYSFWIGAVVGIIVLVRTPAGHRMGIEVPFVPFLAAGYLLVFFTQWNVFPW